MIKIGDFVTQYSAGYWQVIDIKPKIADMDYSNEEVSYKKGEVIGEWIILKKAFTLKMKPKIEFNYCDSYWVKPVSEKVLNEINDYFEKKPKFKEEFDNAEIKLNYMISNCWFNLPYELEEEFTNKLSEFLKSNKLFTIEEFWTNFNDYKQYVSNPSTNYLLNFLTMPWNMDDSCNYLYESCEIVKVNK